MKHVIVLLVFVLLAAPCWGQERGRDTLPTASLQDQRDIVPLREYMEEKFRALDKATTLMQETINARLDANNEWRDESKQRTTLMVTKDEFILWQSRVVEDIRYLRESKATLEGKASQTSVFISYLLSVIGIFLAVVGMAKNWYKGS